MTAGGTGSSSVQASERIHVDCKHLNLLKEFIEVSGRIVLFIFVVCSEASDRRSRACLCHFIRSLLMFPMGLNDMLEENERLVRKWLSNREMKTRCVHLASLMHRLMVVTSNCRNEILRKSGGAEVSPQLWPRQLPDLLPSRQGEEGSL